MLKKATSFVLTRSKPQRTARVRLGFSLAAAALDGLFEHPQLISRLDRSLKQIAEPSSSFFHSLL